MKTVGIASALMGVGISLCLFAGCLTVAEVPDERPIPQSVRDARALFETNLLTEAIIACTQIQRDDPLTPGLAQLQSEITQRLADLRESGTALRQGASTAIALEDIDRQGILPDTYRLRAHVVGETQPIHSLPPKMQEILDKPVSIHLQDVSLSAIIAQISRSENVNIVADGAIGEGVITIEVDNTPLSEVFEYIGRNLGVTFAVGKNIIWVTEGNDEAGGVPLHTRIYRLRKGISKKELEGDGQTLGIIEAVNRFVPQVAGADILFNPRAHAILVKNTRRNLALVEDIIEVLDVRPPQVLIEARFISTGVTDIRELGIDWLLRDNYKVSTRATRDGRQTSAQIRQGATISQTPFAQGTAGLNLTYEGLLTVPAFEAVIHALETIGNSRTLSVPRVTALNNTEAKIRVGEDFRYFEDYDIEEVRTGTDNSGNETYESRMVPTGTPTLEELGIELVVTPSVGADLATINMRLTPEISEFVRWEHYVSTDDEDDSTDNNNGRDNTSGSTVAGGLGIIKLPVFRRSAVDTEVTVRSGETIIMGGLVTSSRVKTESGVPFLSSLPFIGRLFRHDVWEDVSQNLLIFVTSTLISDSGEELIPLEPSDPVRSDGPVELGEGGAGREEKSNAAEQR